MNAHVEVPTQARASWLSLIAEAAGFEAAQIARIELTGRAHGPQSVIVQIVAHDGRVLGAERWEGSAEDLALGVRVDVGVWMTEDDAQGARALAFVDRTNRRTDPVLARDPSGHRGRPISAGRRARLALEIDAHGRAA